MKEQVSLKYAKQSIKRNEHKYLIQDNFENAIIEYMLNGEEIDSLYKYVVENIVLSEREKMGLESIVYFHKNNI